ncbi:MAG TPA: hypothetical protein VGQ18_00620 [Gemmatimonadales bacterium]|nr:hypothetical protein [Gemmatimonadales bacterium]
MKTAAPPSNTTAVAISQGRIDVSWQDNSNNETGFEVQRSTAGAVFVVLALTGAGVINYSDAGLTSATQYCYKVRAFQTNGRRTTYSSFSATACATTPPPPQPGSIEVTTTTTGSHLDSDGYSVRVDGGPDQPTGVNATVTIAGVSGGEHTVQLSGVAPNCSVDGANPRSISVDGGTTEVVFVVTCGPGNTIQVTAVTTGVDLDPDGYVVDLWVWWSWSRLYAGSARVTANGTVTFYGLNPGEYELEFSGVAANCSPIGTNSQWVDLSNGGAAAVGFDVTCTAVTQIAFADVADGNADIYLINSNGTGRTRLTMDPGGDTEPAWSPDGSKIAFVSDRDGNAEIYVMNADGSSPLRLTNAAAGDHGPAWSPDGARIAFWSERDGNAEVYVMNADGTNPVNLTNNPDVDTDPAWSPDGAKIAFGSRGGIYLMSADGSGRILISSPDPNVLSPDAQPAWSPDGQWLAFIRLEFEIGQNIWVMGADGSGPGRLTAGWCQCEAPSNPVWAPDGSFLIAFASNGFTGSGDVVNIFFTSGGFQTSEPLTVGFDPSWRR